MHFMYWVREGCGECEYMRASFRVSECRASIYAREYTCEYMRGIMCGSMRAYPCMCVLYVPARVGM